MDMDMWSSTSVAPPQSRRLSQLPIRTTVLASRLTSRRWSLAHTAIPPTLPCPNRTDRSSAPDGTEADALRFTDGGAGQGFVLRFIASADQRLRRAERDRRNWRGVEYTLPSPTAGPGTRRQNERIYPIHTHPELRGLCII